MEKADIFNVKEQMNNVMNDENKEDLLILIEEFKRSHFPNVLSKSKHFRKKYHMDKKLIHLLLLTEATSHAQIEEYKASAEIIAQLYNEADEPTGDDLILLGQLAFMSDYKLARRIISDAVKQLEQENEPDNIKLARGYLVLGETEEKLEKFIRSIKYYKNSLNYFQEFDGQNTYMILYLHFKIGMLHSTANNVEEAVHYLDKAIALAEENSNPEMKIYSLVSIGKIFGSKEKNEAAFPYLKEALSMLEESTLIDTMVHAEALTEMAYYYFAQSKLEEAVPLYQHAIEIYLQLPISHRTLGMIYMQYAYCLEHKERSNKSQAGANYERAIERLEKTKDWELIENALADVIAFFDATDNTKKKRLYEEKFVAMTNQKNK